MQEVRELTCLPGGKVEGGDREFGMDMYTLLYFKRITNKHLLCSPGSSAQCKMQPRWEGNLEENACSPLSPVRLFETPGTVTCQASLSMECSRQGYWSRLPFPTPGPLLDPGIKYEFLASPALAGGFFATVTPEKPLRGEWIHIYVWLSPT